MRIIYDHAELGDYVRELYASAPGGEVDLSGAPLLLDRFLESAMEVDVDAVFDGRELYVGGVMEHVEEAGVHSGDSACVVPPPTLTALAHERILDYTDRVARGLEVQGLLNIQFAVQGDDVFVLEANPRASRTIPFISKATGVPLAKIATRVMLGETLEDLRNADLLPARTPRSGFVAIKEAVLPWTRFPDEDRVLGPEMRATGEVMGIGPDLGVAYGKSLLAAGHQLPAAGQVFVSLADRDKPAGVEVARRFAAAGYRLLATHGTAGHLARHGVPATHVDKVGDGAYDPVRLIERGEIDIVVNTPQGRRARGDGGRIRRAATRHRVPCVTTVRGGLAVAGSLAKTDDRNVAVAPLQRYHAAMHDG